MHVTSAAGIISLLEEPMPEVKTFALQRLDNIVDEFWPEISEAIEKIEMLHEDQLFQQRELAALVASKVYYHLGSYDDSLTYALGAGELFRVSQATQYVETLVARCIDKYTQLRQAQADRTEDIEMDSRLEAVVNRMFDRCLREGQYQQALGMALETRRLDIFRLAITLAPKVQEMLKYAFDVTMKLIQNRAFRDTILRHMVDLYKSLSVPDYVNISQCYIFLFDAASMSEMLLDLARGNADEQLIAYQIAFDLYECATQEFITLLVSAVEDFLRLEATVAVVPSSTAVNVMPALVDPITITATSAEPILIVDSPNESAIEYHPAVHRLQAILSGEISIQLHSQFLIRCNKTDNLILKYTKETVRASICHTAVIIANGLMNAGTTSDYFLRENLEWLSRASNWAKMTAVSSLGVIHRGHEKDALNFMQTYLPKETGVSSGFTESGCLYALGLIHANHGDKIVPYLKQALHDSPNELNTNIKHGGCLGLGLAAMGTCDETVLDLLRQKLYEDDAIVGEAAGISMGLVMLGSGNKGTADEMIAYCQESQHEKILRGLAVGISLIMLGRLEDADPLIMRLTYDKDAILRRAAVYMIGMAYCGSGNNGAIQKLLHISVSDVNDDVRRAAVSSLGFLLCRTPEQCPSMVSLLAESYNPHVRYGAALALGIACAGTGNREAVDILEPIIVGDRINFVRQGALIASAMVCIQHTEYTCSRAPALRKLYAEVIRDKHEDVMTKFGAILSQGIIDAGGRNMTLGMMSRAGHVNMMGVVGMLLFMHHWYWYPMAHCLSLSFTPSCVIALNSDMNMPKMQFRSNAKPSSFGYPPLVEERKREEMAKTSSALLSVSRRGRRDKFKIKLGNLKVKNVKDGKKSRGSSLTKRVHKEEKKEEPKDEPNWELLDNPARVIPPQLKVLSMAEDGVHIPIKHVNHGGIIVMKNLDNKLDEIVEFIPAHSPGIDVENEPEPPEPFEWIEDPIEETIEDPVAVN